MNFNTWFVDRLRYLSVCGEDRHDKVSLTQQRYTTDFAEGLPLLYLKPTPWRLAIRELRWFMSPSEDYAELHNSGVKWWQPWLEDYAGEGFNWEAPIKSLPLNSTSLPYKHHAEAYTRISNILRSGDHGSTRMYCNLWPTDDKLDEAILPPCALAYQVTCARGKLNITVTQRSADLLCGVPSNVIQYSWLLQHYAAISGLRPGRLVVNFGDLHAYKTHLAQPEYQELTSWQRIETALELSRSPGVPMSFVSSGDNHWNSPVNISGQYTPCSHLSFPVVPVHTSRYKNP